MWVSLARSGSGVARWITCGPHDEPIWNMMMAPSLPFAFAAVTAARSDPEPLLLTLVTFGKITAAGAAALASSKHADAGPRHIPRAMFTVEPPLTAHRRFEEGYADQRKILVIPVADG